ncbi:conserved hypothetical protein [Crenothrix polyspora]|jgi:hypothetical protein|uniref:DUF2914 domain-containing protein n=1 Tax=Crenothrix polyspora TaxID=360316 RepID=A0A1R4H0K0_9GAMM|nr:DUF2914 domain-containing protein [Crenothrix polyspora]SJM89768.1 conserved hypothetical protein [Crenothrix polyspora]
MAEKKSIVIKLKYPTGQLPGKKIPAPKTITEWNYKRIAFALGGISAVVALIVHFSSATPEKATAAKVAATPSTAPVTIANVPTIASEVAQKQNTGAELFKKNVLRTQLAPKIVDSEPVGEVNLPLKAGEKTPVPVYYFAELADMKGKTIYHEWLLDDKVISRKTVNISDNTWRTSSRQMVAYTTNSNWTVRLVDDTGQVLSEKKFTVILRK